MRKNLFIVVALVALLGLQFADCMSAMTQDQQRMNGCGSMPCDPSNQSHDCCKGMVSSQSPSVLPVTNMTLHAPVIVVTDILVSPQAMTYPEASRLDFEAPSPSPPELYTLHASLLICSSAQRCGNPPACPLLFLDLPLHLPPCFCRGPFGRPPLGRPLRCSPLR